MTIAPKGYPPPRANEQQLEMYDSPGFWTFVGSIRIKVLSEIMVLPISEPVVVLIVQGPSGLRVIDPDNDLHFDAFEWFGWWTKLAEG